MDETVTPMSLDTQAHAALEPLMQTIADQQRQLTRQAEIIGALRAALAAHEAAHFT